MNEWTKLRNYFVNDSYEVPITTVSINTTNLHPIYNTTLTLKTINQFQPNFLINQLFFLSFSQARMTSINPNNYKLSDKTGNLTAGGKLLNPLKCHNPLIEWTPTGWNGRVSIDGESKRVDSCRDFPVIKNSHRTLNVDFVFMPWGKGGRDKRLLGKEIDLNFCWGCNVH